MFDWIRGRHGEHATAPGRAGRASDAAPPRPAIRALEPRFVFDAAAHAAAESAHAAAAQGPAAQRSETAPDRPAHGAAPGAHTRQGEADLHPADVHARGGPEAAPRHEIVVVDANVPDVQTLLKGIPPTAQVIMIDPGRDGFDQLADALRGRQDIDAIHIISHGTAGDLRLGTSELTGASIVARYADDLAAIGRALGPNGDLLIYGCDFAAGPAGADAARLLARATGADVAASSNATGDAALGGDWTLEVEDGPIESGIIVDREAQAGWHHVLAPLTYSISGNPAVEDGSGNAVTTSRASNGVNYFDVSANVVGASALWSNVGTVGGVSVDLKATVVARGAGDDAVSFGTSGDDATILVRATTATAPPTNQAGQITIRWDIVRHDNGVALPVDVDLQIGDIDGVGGAPNTRETVTPSQTGLTSYAIDSPSDLVIDTTNNRVSASGTQNETASPPASASVVRYDFTNVSTYQVTYTLVANATTGQAAFQNDGNRGLTLGNPQTMLVPKVDLDGNDSSGAVGYDYRTTFTEKGAAVAVSDTDPLVTNTAAIVQDATIVLTNAKASDRLTIGTLPSGITGSLDTSVAGQITVTLTGDASPATYQSAIRAVTYDNTSSAPDTSDRLIDTRVTSNGVHGTSARTTISVVAVDDAPVNHLPSAQTTSEDTNLVFSSSGGNALTVSDVDAGPGNVTTTLTVTRGTLALGSTSGVSVTGNGTASVVLTGTVAQVNAALDGTTYRPAQDDNGAITLTMSTNDNGNTGAGGPKSATGTLGITVTAVDDRPVNGLPQPQMTPENTDLVFSSGGGNALTVSDVDAGSGNLTTTLTATRGTFVLGSTSGVTVTGNGTASVVVTGTIAQINAALDGAAYRPAQNDNGAISLTMRTNDNGNTGSGGPKSATDTLAITVTAVDTAPVNHLPAAQTTQEDTDLVFSSSGGNALTISDVDAGSGALTTTLAATRGTLTLGSTAGVSVTGNGTGSVTLTGTVAQINAALDGATYRPAPDDNGAVTLTMSTNDNGNTGAGGPKSASDTLGITVAAVNDAPVNHLPAAQMTEENTDLVFSSSVGNAVTVSDVDAGSGTITTTLAVDRGTVTLGSTAGVSVTGDGTGSVTLTGTVAQINAALDGTTYRPVPGDTGPVTLTVTSDDTGNTGSGGPKSATDTLAITVNAASGQANAAPVNNLPPAQATPEDTDLVFSGANALTVSDADAGSGALTTTLAVTRGTVTLGSISGVTVAGNGTGSVTLTGTVAQINAALDGTTYRPAHDDNGAVTLTVTTTDNGNTGSGGAKSATDTLGITVAAVDDAPVNHLPAAQTTQEDTDLVFSSPGGNAITISDVDAGSGALTTTLAATRGTLTLGSTAGVSVTGNGTGSVTLTGTVAQINAALDGATYRPAPDDNGAVTLTVTTTDNGNSGSGGPRTASDTLGIAVAAVDDRPVNSLPPPQVTAEDTSLVLSSANGNALSISDVDAGSGNLTTTLRVTRGTLVLGSTSGVSVTGNGTDRIVLTGTVVQINAALDGTTYRPARDDSGAITLTMRTSDNGNTGSGGPKSATDTLAIMVTPVNDPPVHILPPAQQTPEDTALVFSAADGNAITVQDVDAGPGTVTTTVSVGRGTVRLGTTSGVSVTGEGTGSVTLSGTVAQVNAALDGMAYRPAQDDNGPVTLTVATSDNGNTGSGGPRSATDTLAITVTPVDDPPAHILPPAQQTPEDTALVFSAAGGNALSIADIDAGAGALTTTLSVDRGTVLLGSTSGVTVTGNGTGSVTLTGTVAQINAALDGTTYRPVQDDSGAITLTLTTNDNGNTGAGGPRSATDTLAIAILAVDDAPVNVLPPTQRVPENADFVLSPARGNALAIQDVDAGTGAVTTTLAVTRGTITLGSRAGITVAGDGTDRVTLTGTVAQINAALDGTTYRPLRNDSGDVALTITTTDNGDAASGGPKTATGTLTLAIENPPTADSVPDRASEDGQAVSVDLGRAFHDPNGDPLTYSLSGTLPPGLGLDPATGVVSGTIRPDASGPTGVRTYAVTITATDPQGAGASASFGWRVANLAPVARDDAATVAQDARVTIDVLKAASPDGTSGRDTDPDGDPLVIVASGSGAPAAGHGRVSVVDGKLDYVPDSGFVGTDTIRYTVDDGNGGRADAVVLVTVTRLNHAPDAKADPLVVPAGQIGTGAIAARDPDGDALTYRIVAPPAHGSAGIARDGSYVYVPDASFEGADVFAIAVSDGRGGETVVSVPVTVAPSPSAPPAAVPPAAIPPAAAPPPPSPVPLSLLTLDGVLSAGAESPVDVRIQVATPVVPNAVPRPEPSIGTTGYVLSAVARIESLHSVAGVVLADGAVVAAVNGADPLRGIDIVSYRPAIQQEADRLGKLGDRPDGLPDTPSPWFSPRPYLGRSLDLSFRDGSGPASPLREVSVEAIRRPDTLALNVLALGSDGLRITGVALRSLDGGPGPDWLETDGRGSFWGTPPAGVDIVDVEVEITTRDGRVVHRPIRIDTTSGEVRALSAGRHAEVPAAPRLSDQIAAFDERPDRELDLIERALSARPHPADAGFATPARRA